MIGIVVLAHLPTVAYGMRLFVGGASCVAREASAENIAAHIRGKLGVRNKRELIGLTIPVQSATEIQ